MLLDRLAGRRVRSEVPAPDFPRIPAPPPVRDLARATIALVTDGGLVPKGNPDGIEALAATRYGAYGLGGQRGLDPGEYDNVHRGYDTTVVKQDPHRLVPLESFSSREETGMRSKLLAVFVVCAAFSAAPASVEPADMQPGLWEFTTKVNMPGMPIAMPPHTTQMCYTKKDLEDPRNTVPKGEQGKDCQIKDYKVSGNTATWAMQCTGEHPMTGTVTAISGATSSSGTMKMMWKQDGQTMEMTNSWEGRRVGDCK